MSRIVPPVCPPNSSVLSARLMAQSRQASPSSRILLGTRPNIPSLLSLVRRVGWRTTWACLPTVMMLISTLSGRLKKNLNNCLLMRDQRLLRLMELVVSNTKTNRFLPATRYTNSGGWKEALLLTPSTENIVGSLILAEIFVFAVAPVDSSDDKISFSVDLTDFCAQRKFCLVGTSSS